jgi:hypothetical protein
MLNNDFILNWKIDCAIEKDAIDRSVEKFHKWNEDIVTAEEIAQLESDTVEFLAQYGLTPEDWFQDA